MFYPSVTPAADTLSTCEANVCTCPNGTPSVAVGTGGTLCEADADVDCSVCDAGFSPSVTPAADTLSTCEGGLNVEHRTHAYVTKTKAFEETYIKRITIDILSGLEFLHAKGIIHREPKDTVGRALSTCEANVCTCPNGTPSVAVGAGATLCEADGLHTKSNFIKNYITN